MWAAIGERRESERAREDLLVQRELDPRHLGDGSRRGGPFPVAARGALDRDGFRCRDHDADVADGIRRRADEVQARLHGVRVRPAHLHAADGGADGRAGVVVQTVGRDQQHIDHAAVQVVERRGQFVTVRHDAEPPFRGAGADSLFDREHELVPGLVRRLELGIEADERRLARLALDEIHDVNERKAGGLTGGHAFLHCGRCITIPVVVRQGAAKHIPR